MSRAHWIGLVDKITRPVLLALSQKQFKNTFLDSKPTACLEAFARVLVGIAPFIELGRDEKAIELGTLARQALDAATDPASPDYLWEKRCGLPLDQVLVETALFAQALLRAPNELWVKLEERVKSNVIKVIKSSRSIEPHDNNWVLFPSMIEAFFLAVGKCDIDKNRLESGLSLFQKWYVGDGVYGDGEELHFDYYNSYVIHPMLTDIIGVLEKLEPSRWKIFAEVERKRMQRWATLQERMIAPDGTFPPLGRSLTYRCGAFHGLALCALRKQLPDNLKPAQARVALTHVIRATLECPNTFVDGWLTIGLYGKQERLAEPYINHGSVYMCCTVFAPLGLCKDDPFWTDEDVKTTWELCGNHDRDRPYVECERKRGKCV